MKKNILKSKYWSKNEKRVKKNSSFLLKFDFLWRLHYIHKQSILILYCYILKKNGLKLIVFICLTVCSFIHINICKYLVKKNSNNIFAIIAFFFLVFKAGILIVCRMQPCFKNKICINRFFDLFLIRYRDLIGKIRGTKWEL